jgi:hypothetical protein
MTVWLRLSDLTVQLYQNMNTLRSCNFYKMKPNFLSENSCLAKRCSRETYQPSAIRLRARSRPAITAKHNGLNLGALHPLW